MSYRLSSKKRQQRKNFWLRLVATLFFLGIALGVFSLFGGGLAKTTAGIVSTAENVGDSISAIGVSKQELIKENQELRRMLDEQTLESSLIQAQKEWNDTLLNELGREARIPKVLAGVVKKPPFTPYDTYALDAGRDAGIEIGDIALFSEYVVLGLVTRVTQSSAKLDLFSSPGRTTVVEVNGVNLEAQGQGGGTMHVDVPRDFEVTKGEAIKLPGYELLVVGEVVEILQKPQDSFKRLVVTTPVNIYAVPVVSIVDFEIDPNIEQTYEAPEVFTTE